VTEQSIRKLLSVFQISPNFLQVIHAFGEKTEDDDNSFGIFSINAEHEACVTGIKVSQH